MTEPAPPTLDELKLLAKQDGNYQCPRCGGMMDCVRMADADVDACGYVYECVYVTKMSDGCGFAFVEWQKHTLESLASEDYEIVLDLEEQDDSNRTAAPDEAQARAEQARDDAHRHKYLD